MKRLLAAGLLLLSTSALAQGLSDDFKCLAKSNGGEEFSMTLTNFDFAKEVILKKGTTVCTYLIINASYKPGAASQNMIIEIEKKESCKGTSKFKPISSGFLKINLDDSEPRAFTLALAGHDTLSCEIKSFNKKKLVDRIRNSF